MKAQRKIFTPSLNRERGMLIDKKIAGTITTVESLRLTALNADLDRRLEPLAKKRMAALNVTLRKLSRKYDSACDHCGKGVYLELGYCGFCGRDECKRRALAYLRKQHERDFTPASFVVGAIWPGVMFHAQGGGAAASRILKALERDGLARWSSNSRNWGWVLTESGKCHT